MHFVHVTRTSDEDAQYNTAFPQPGGSGVFDIQDFP
jgi:hypothetical protein